MVDSIAIVSYLPAVSRAYPIADWGLVKRPQSVPSSVYCLPHRE